MIVINAVIDNERNLIISPSRSFVGEKNSDMIEIDIGPFAQDDYEFFVLNFDNGISEGVFASNIIRTAEDKPAYIDNGLICCPIDSSHTASGTLRIQLEAHKTDDGVLTIRKSSVACIKFDDSVMGQINSQYKPNSVLERLVDAEGRIAAAESRIASTESRINDIENNGLAEIMDEEFDSVRSEITELDNELTGAETSINAVSDRVSVIEGYDISDKFDTVNQKIDEIESEIESINAFTSIPVAGNDTVGGVKIPNTSEISVSDDGSIRLRYGNMDSHSIFVLFAIAMLSETGRVETVIGETIDSIAQFVYSNSALVGNGTIDAIAFAVFESGEITWLDEKYEERTSRVRPNCVYVLRLDSEGMYMSGHEGIDLRELIMEGI